MDPIEPWIDGNAVRQLAARLLSSPDSEEISDSPDAGFGPGFEGFISGEASPSSAAAAPVAKPPPERPAPVVDRVIDPVAKPVARQAEPAPRAKPEAQPARPPEPETQPAPPEPEAKPFLPAAPPARADADVPAGDEGPVFQRREDPRPEQETNRGPLMERMLRFREWLGRHAKARSVFILDHEGQVVLDDPAYAKLQFLARSLSNAYRPVPGQPGNVHVKVGAEAFLVVIPVETAFGCLILGTVLPKPLDAPSVEIVAKALAETVQPGGR